MNDLHVEDGGAEGVLVAVHTHSLLHSKHFGVVESSLVEVLQGLRDQEQGQQEHIDPDSDSLVLLRGLAVSDCRRTRLTISPMALEAS